ncbi:hypothetical protein A3I56_00450 [Candidatus Roizmanbacteria bacterium RIFCSPLOWO2_02_FULL_43_10]|uniref:Uncharacterized protein n=2 Tax=Candidatus Roizmaniibacteriota TaxID=1752723 RepID=A0A1F7K1P1_9BACT|nr:MAG: hypothetical protein A3D08_00345 [Candidatus Roizmanbacteria bacterium RIFCSPHIGHO2_02_FULL_43_11]OGK61781.1 MAG: hypothetical protein A3I56_00450 [Candidatus Roizmanbacteria bacterium RIFCSPLOWO2_02_FULL_43_10]
MKKLLKWPLFIFLVLIIVTIFAGFIKDTKTDDTKKPVSINSEYKIISRRDSKTVENIDVLIGQNKTNPESVAIEIKKICTKPCNIDLYDNEEAYNLQMEYDTLMQTPGTETTQLDDWTNKNYVFVADHYIGTINFDTGEYNDYPFRDWKYKELKNK